MNESNQLYWMSKDSNWRVKIKNLQSMSKEEAWNTAVSLANTQLDFIQTNVLDNAIQKIFQIDLPKKWAHRTLRLAILSSSTVSHLLPAIRVAGLRRGLWITTYECDYGQYFQDILNESSALYDFHPNIVLFSWDAHHLTQSFNIDQTSDEIKKNFQSVTEQIVLCWKTAHEKLHALIIQQTILPIFSTVLGNNENRLLGSKFNVVNQLNHWLRENAENFSVDLFSVDQVAFQAGVQSWFDLGLWYRSKQEISPKVSPIYGDHIVRLIAARIGRSYKCLVLDLDNTLWGGVIGDDGLQGIILGQGSALGESFVEFQRHILELSRRGIILAVCSKNDEKNALEPFEKHPEMILRKKDIACFAANWNHKADNIRIIAESLNIGLDSIVFLDDNPFERNSVRENLPMVAVPEINDDPVSYAKTLADAGYFEGTTITDEDRGRALQYKTNMAREELRKSTINLDGYLESLKMELVWKKFDTVGIPRITQLINKTNQFNLTTRRYTEEEVIKIKNNKNSFGLQLRLLDRFGDNGIISIIICKKQNEDFYIDTWAMSCRVLGRKIEQAALGLIIEKAKNFGVKRLIGEYIPTIKNAMVKNHYINLGFTVIEENKAGGSRSVLEFDSAITKPLPIILREGEIHE